MLNECIFEATSSRFDDAQHSPQRITVPMHPATGWADRECKCTVQCHIFIMHTVPVFIDSQPPITASWMGFSHSWYWSQRAALLPPAVTLNKRLCKCKKGSLCGNVLLLSCYQQTNHALGKWLGNDRKLDSKSKKGFAWMPQVLTCLLGIKQSLQKLNTQCPMY